MISKGFHEINFRERQFLETISRDIKIFEIFLANVSTNKLYLSHI